MASGEAVEASALHTGVHRVTRRYLEPAQDLLVVGVAVALFGLMLRTLAVLFRELVAPTLEFGVVIAEVLFMLVMIEVVRLLIVYLREHRVAVDFMVELGIVATLREVILHGVTELSWQQLGALAFFLMVLGALLRFGDLRIPLPAVSGHAVRASDDAGAFRGPSRREAARWPRDALAPDAAPETAGAARRGSADED